MLSKKLAINATPAEVNSYIVSMANAVSSKFISRINNQIHCLPNGPVPSSMMLAVRSSDAGFLDFLKHCSMRF